MTPRVRTRTLGLLIAGSLAALVGLLLGRGPWSHDSGPARRAVPPTPAGDVLVAPSLAGLPRATPAPRGRATSADVESDTRADNGLAEIPLRVSAFDIHTGRAVAGAWSHLRGPATGAPYSPEQVADPDVFARAQEQQAGQAERRAQEYEDSFVALGEVGRQPLGDGNEIVNLQLSVRLAEGWVLPDPRSLFAPWVELVAYRVAGAREAVALVPAAREAPLEVVVLGPDGAGAEGATLEIVGLSGQQRQVTVETLGPGRLRVRGLPHLPGEPVTAYVVWQADAEEVSSEEPGEPSSEQPLQPQVSTVVPESLAEPWRVVVRLAGPCGDLPYSESITFDVDYDVSEDLDASGEPTGSVRVLAQGWDGRALREATVSGTPVDEAGQTLLTGLPVGRRTLRLDSPGRLLAVGGVEVLEGREATLVLREPRGGRLAIEVVDAQGDDLPGAMLVLDTRWFDVADGVQRLDLACDEQGRRTLERVQPGPCQLSGRWGSRHGTAEVTVREQETTRVVVVLAR